jgi:hypothetical protein
MKLLLFLILSVFWASAWNAAWASLVITSKVVMISDQVKAFSLSGDKKTYAVVFNQHPEAYHLAAKSKAMKCLTTSMREKRLAFIWVNSKTLGITKCDLPPHK